MSIDKKDELTEEQKKILGIASTQKSAEEMTEEELEKATAPETDITDAAASDEPTEENTGDVKADESTATDNADNAATTDASADTDVKPADGTDPDIPVPTGNNFPIPSPSTIPNKETPVAKAAIVKESPTPETKTDLERRVEYLLREYKEKMAPRMPTADSTILAQQVNLFTAMKLAINCPGDEFNRLMKTVFAFFNDKENKDGIFHETKVFRGMDNIPLSKNDREAFVRFINMFKVLADPRARSITLKQIDLQKTLQYAVTENARNRVLSFFNM